MARMNISIPDALKQRMAEWNHVNWSEVAAQAFEAELRKPRRDIINVYANPAHALGPVKNRNKAT